MKEQTLYTKYRPQSFDQVVGQAHITETLSYQIKEKKLHHAYLFVGGRGLGKTTVARIFAQDLHIDAFDIFEIDAATHTGVDNIRELKESVETLPTRSVYKIFIIDEVHMLSKSAFNALLKTIEEPPSYVIFILATTEYSKIPETIISRCETHMFKEPSVSEIESYLKNIVHHEEKKPEEGVLYTIAQLANGSFRDSLSILQKILYSTSSEHISNAYCEKLLGLPESQSCIEFIDALSKKDVSKALSLVKHFKDKEKRITTKKIVNAIRLCLRNKYAKNTIESVRGMYTALEFDAYTTNTYENFDFEFLANVIDSIQKTSFEDLSLTLELLAFRSSE